jgi:hypothetical protein
MGDQKFEWRIVHTFKEMDEEGVFHFQSLFIEKSRCPI